MFPFQKAPPKKLSVTSKLTVSNQIILDKDDSFHRVRYYVLRYVTVMFPLHAERKYSYRGMRLPVCDTQEALL